MGPEGEEFLPPAKLVDQDLPGGSVAKTLPVNAGDTGLIPEPGRPHMPRSKQAPASQLLSLCSRAHKPRVTTTDPCTPESVHPALCNQRQAHAATKTQHSQINKNYSKKLINRQWYI